MELEYLINDPDKVIDMKRTLSVKRTGNENSSTVIWAESIRLRPSIAHHSLGPRDKTYHNIQSRLL